MMLQATSAPCLSDDQDRYVLWSCSLIPTIQTLSNVMWAAGSSAAALAVSSAIGHLTNVVGSAPCMERVDLGEPQLLQQRSSPGCHLVGAATCGRRAFPFAPWATARHFHISEGLI